MCPHRHHTHNETEKRKRKVAEAVESSGCAHLDGLPEEALAQDLPVEQVAGPEDLL